jgi:hypothetical protein
MCVIRIPWSLIYDMPNMPWPLAHHAHPSSPLQSNSFDAPSVSTTRDHYQRHGDVGLAWMVTLARQAIHGMRESCAIEHIGLMAQKEDSSTHHSHIPQVGSAFQSVDLD